MVAILTKRVFPDEPAYGIYDGPEGGRWVQKIWVVRGDALARYQVDIGPVEDFPKAMPMAMPAYGEESVASLQWHAERNRHDDRWWKRQQEMKAQSTLIADILRQEEEKIQYVVNRSVIGPHHTKQRNR